MIAVTGATGHIGNVLVRKLAGTGMRIRALMLPGEDPKPLESTDAEIVSGDIRDKNSLIKAFSGAKIVFHLAGMISILRGQRKMLDEVNVGGTKNVIDACLSTGAEKLIYTSSIHALKEPPAGTIITEEQGFDPFKALGDYAKSKAKASMEVLKAVKDGLYAVIICPTGVIGPFDFKGSEMGILTKYFLNKKIPACVKGAYDFVDVRDAAEGMIEAAKKGRSGETYILGGEQITIRGLFSMIEQLSGIKAPKLNIPSGLARSCGLAAAPIYKYTRVKPLLTPYSIDVLQSNSLVSSAKAKRELGYTFRSLKDSIIDSIVWFKEEEQKCCRNLNFKSSVSTV
jgi:dihydroflavonol-4-reductase